MKLPSKYWQLVILLALLSGCIGEPIVPVSDLTTPRDRYATRIVRPGDTLYMLAWEAGLDYRLLAEWNKLSEPFHMKVGLRIRLTPLAGSKLEKDREVRATSPPLPQKTFEENSYSPEEEVSAKIDSNLQIRDWLWPANGEIIQKFTGKNGKNGIDIAGRIGDPIRASASGVVVYAGSGLRGYGKLLIVQHDEVFLSAYAHNHRLLVKEGNLIDRGQAIAEMGDTDAESPRVHFEIRRDGKPVDPLAYLPSQ